MTINFPPSFAKSWKSTLVGLIAVIFGVVQGFQSTDWHTLIADHSFQTKVLVALLGFIVKDGNVTGGTVGQPSSLEALTDANQAPSRISPPSPTAISAAPPVAPSAPPSQPAA